MLVSDITGLGKCSEKVIEVKCDLCGAITNTTVNNYNLSQQRNGDTGMTKCRSCSCKITAEKRIGVVSPFKGIRKPPELRGENSSMWNGGKYVDVHGYVMKHIDIPRYETANGWESYRKEHTLIIENELNRNLIKGEIIHHVDGNRQNNELSNLWLSDNTGHRNAHQSLQVIGYRMIKAGLIQFDHENGKYVAHTKLGELLERIEGFNQQPSQMSNQLEGSETSGRVLLIEDSNSTTSAQHNYINCDDIVRTVDMTNETTELLDKEPVG